MNEPTPTYIIFGATGGIGAALARRLATRPVRLALVARQDAPLQALAAELQSQAFPLDATSFDAVEACVNTVAEQGPLVGVANCVGSLLLKPAHSTSEREWLDTVAANLTTAFAVLRASAKAMFSTGGAIALVSSAAAQIGLPNHEAIAAAKAGIEGLVRSAAASYASKGIRVNAVAPGLVRTPLTARLTSNEATLKASTALHALGRIGEPDDIAAALAWLLHPEQRWITGQILGVDGGLATVRAK